jgi:hypothetical protein
MITNTKINYAVLASQDFIDLNTLEAKKRLTNTLNNYADFYIYFAAY